MATHKFSVGDQVRLVVSKYAGDVPDGVYTISRKLPVEASPSGVTACKPRVSTL